MAERIQVDGLNGTNGVAVDEGVGNMRLNGAQASGDDIRLPLLNRPAYSVPRKLRVITIGAGFSGITFAHKIRYQHPELDNIIDNTIYEARAEVGGTWYVNKYPGLQCDVPSHIYAFPFDPAPDWDQFFSTGPEIERYIVNTVKKWNLDRDLELNTRVVEATWQEDAGQWKVVVEKEGVRRVEMADVVVSAQGFLNHWKWPAIPGLHDFEGQKVHSADWDHGYDYSHKKIAVIGNGSSGIQLIPALSKLEGTEVISFQREATWVVSGIDPGRLIGRPGIGMNPKYTDEDKEKFRNDKEFHHNYRKTIIHNINQGFRMFIKDTPEYLQTYEFAKKDMVDTLKNDPRLCEMLVPKWELGCRRLTPGPGYLDSFLLPNVSLTQSPITKITKDSIVTEDGKEYKVDVVVCATGFEVSYCPPYPIIGRNQASLDQKWAEEPESYLSLACPDFPNLFFFMGPNSIVGHGSLVEGLGWISEYIIKWLKKMAFEDIHSMAPTQQATDEFIKYGDEIHKTIVWTGKCRSWYKNNRVDGRVTACFPGSALLFKEMIESIRGEDYDIRYKSPNRFRFMGNGFTEYELNPKNDLAWYVKKL